MMMARNTPRRSSAHFLFHSLCLYLLTFSFTFSVSICSGYRWVSGDAFTYEHWASGEPNDWDGKEQCVAVYGRTGKWNDDKCHLLYNWICSVRKGTSAEIVLIFPW